MLSPLRCWIVLPGVMVRVGYYMSATRIRDLSHLGLGNSRALKLALKAARVCIGITIFSSLLWYFWCCLIEAENKQLDLGLKILRTAAARLDALEESGTDIQIQSLTTEYYMLRVYLVIPKARPTLRAWLINLSSPGFKDGLTSPNTCFPKCQNRIPKNTERPFSRYAIMWANRRFRAASMIQRSNGWKGQLSRVRYWALVFSNWAKIWDYLFCMLLVSYSHFSLWWSYLTNCSLGMPSYQFHRLTASTFPNSGCVEGCKLPTWIFIGAMA